MTIIDQQMVGDSDDQILEVCTAEERIIVTLGLDFADIRSYPPSEHFGIVALRPAQQDKLNVLDLLRRTVPLFDTENLKHRLWIVDEDKVRIRGEA